MGPWSPLASNHKKRRYIHEQRKPRYCARSVSGSRIPSSLRLFLLSLAIFDDVGAILVVAVGYGGALSWTALAVVAALVVAVLVGTRLGIRGVAVNVLSGAGLWLALDASGIHPTLAGVILGMMTPAREWVSDERLHAIFERVLSHPKGRRRSGDTTDRADLQRAGLAAREALSPVE
jgi:NhaA family Na+:H+ antiporter